MLNTGKFAGKTVIISGGSRGIGKAIALKLAKDGANIAILAKTAEPHPKLPGTIYSVAKEIEAAGGQALPCKVDIREEQSVQEAVENTVRQFGGVDVCVNNASAISLTKTLDTPMKRYDLMNQVNARGTFLLSQKCIPYLKQSENPHILNLSPPLLMDKMWFSNHVAYTIAKYGMSMCVLGMADEFKPDGIAVNALWPKTTVWTSAMEMISGGDDAAGSRTPEIVADAAYAMLSRSSREYTGNFAIDEEVLSAEGVTDFSQYDCVPGAPLTLDLFVPGAVAGTIGVERKKSRKSIKSATLEQVLVGLEKVLKNPDVQKLGGVYDFQLKENGKARSIHIDLSNGKIGEGPAEKSEVIFELATADFIDMAQGELAPANAFMMKKLKIKGDVTQALKLAKVFKKTQK